jgi:hypothetical protein
MIPCLTPYDTIIESGLPCGPDSICFQERRSSLFTGTATNDSVVEQYEQCCRYALQAYLVRMPVTAGVAFPVCQALYILSSRDGVT